eukprot:1020628-Pelagomonas_calceolata.AAC.5
MDSIMARNLAAKKQPIQWVDNDCHGHCRDLKQEVQNIPSGCNLDNTGRDQQVKDITKVDASTS